MYLLILVSALLASITGGTSCSAGRGGRMRSPDFHTKGQEQVFTLPLFNGFTPYGQTEIR